MRGVLVIIFVVCMLAIPAIAYEDRFFSIKNNPGGYEVLPGDAVDFVFNVSNRDLIAPRNATVFIKDCPVTWKCEQKLLVYADDGLYSESLEVNVPETAIPRKYTMYIMLESEWDTRRGDDTVVVTALSPEHASTLSYEEYLAKEAERKAAAEERARAVDTYVPPVPENKPAPVPELYETVVEEEVEPEVVPDKTPSVVEVKAAEIAENVERLESSHQFVEYASVVLGAILVLIAIGAFVTYKKEK